MRSIPYQRFWLSLPGLGNYQVYYEKVNHRGVKNDEGRPNNSFVGSILRPEKQMLEIIHSRKLGEVDLLHEVIEQIHKNLPHCYIDPLCSELIEARKRGQAALLIAMLGLGIRDCARGQRI